MSQLAKLRSYKHLGCPIAANPFAKLKIQPGLYGTGAGGVCQEESFGIGDGTGYCLLTIVDWQGRETLREVVIL